MAKKVFITGASSGIGRALAHELALRGYDLGLTARRYDALVGLREAIVAENPGCNVSVRELDVRDFGRISAVMAELATELGGLDIVVANAGIGHGYAVGESPLAETRATVETNLLGAMLTVEAAAESFLKQGRGHIVGISSLMAQRGLPGNAVYCSSKAGFSTYMEAAAAELTGRGIKVTLLEPGFIDTPINAHLKFKPFAVTPRRGAQMMADMIEGGVRRSAVPAWPWNLAGFVARRLPFGLLARAGKLKY